GWHPPSFYDAWINVNIVLGDNEDDVEGQLRRYRQAREALDACRLQQEASTRSPATAAWFVTRSVAIKRRVAGYEPPIVARFMLEECAEELRSIRRLDPSGGAVLSAVNNEYFQVSLSLARVQPNREQSLKQVNQLLRDLTSRSTANSIPLVLGIVDHLIELADATPDGKNRSEFLDKADAMLRPLIEAPTPDWRVYSRFVRAISKRSGLEGAVPRRLIDNGLKVLVQIPTAARTARITRLNAELLRRNLSRLGADTDPALMRKALAAAEGALRQAAEQDPEDPGNDLEYALLYQAAALASSAKEDFEKYAALAEAMFRKAYDTHTASPSVTL